MDAPFTGAGDGGETWCLLAGGRVSKTHPCIEAVGALDEAEAAVALARTLAARAGLRGLAETLEEVERLLFRIGYSLSGRGCITREDLGWVEAEAERLWRLARGWRGFRLNGATPEAAAAAAARTAVRRAERSLIRCLETLPPNRRPRNEKLLLAVVNRLSSLLYAAQAAADTLQAQEPPEAPSC